MAKPGFEYIEIDEYRAESKKRLYEEDMREGSLYFAMSSLSAAVRAMSSTSGRSIDANKAVRMAIRATKVVNDGVLHEVSFDILTPDLEPGIPGMVSMDDGYWRSMPAIKLGRSPVYRPVHGYFVEYGNGLDVELDELNVAMSI